MISNEFSNAAAFSIAQTEISRLAVEFSSGLRFVASTHVTYTRALTFSRSCMKMSQRREKLTNVNLFRGEFLISVVTKGDLVKLDLIYGKRKEKINCKKIKFAFENFKIAHVFW